MRDWRHSAACRAPPFPLGKHHLRPPVSHCSPAGSWEAFSPQMSTNKDVHVRERGKKGGVREETEAVGVFGKQRESRRERPLQRREEEGKREERENREG